jgi:hypothetical protein
MWLFHLGSLDKVAPKCLWLIAIGILFPLNVKLKLYLTSVVENNIISVLSGLKDINHLNDIREKLLSLSRLFADDTSLGYSSQNVVEIENVINHDLCELNTWSTKWLMSFNPDKTEIMLFSNTDVRYNFNFTFNGNNIPITTSHKHLGVTLSSDAKWNNHIENIILSVSIATIPQSN